MQNYDGQEMVIRPTKLGKFQVLPVNYTPADMSRAPVLATVGEAQTFISRPMPRWIADERANAAEAAPHVGAYAAVLAHPSLREMRREIQELYQEACHQSKLASDAQRAAVRGMGQLSCIGRDIGAVRQGNADYQADEADDAWRAHRVACHKYELAVQAAMRDAGIPVEMFRSPVLA